MSTKKNINIRGSLNIRGRKSSRRATKKAQEVLYFNSEEFNNLNTTNNNLRYDNFNKILGSGGFGLIYKHNTKAIVSKFIYSKSSCLKGKEEYEIFSHIYNTFMDVSMGMKSKCLIPKQIYIPKPIKFSNKTIKKDNNEFSCSFTMEQILPIEPYNEMIHIILKQDYARFTGKLVGRNYMYPINKTTNPSRGYFASSKDIQKILNDNKKFLGDMTSINVIAYNLGYIYSFLIGVCKIFPRDIEYLLAVKNNIISIIVLDFGMCEMIENETDDEIVDKIVDIAYMDLYFPYKTENLYKDFENGIKDSMNCLDEKYKNIMTNFLEKY
jgi:hypothetical protein